MSLFRRIFMACFACVAFNVAGDTASTIYWPMSDGDMKNFSGYGGKTATRLVQDNSQGAPRFSVNVYFSTNAAPATNFGGSSSCAYSNATVLNFGASIGTNTLTFSPPWPMLNDTLLGSGGTFSSSFTARIGTTNDPINATSAVVPAGNVTVPAGLFRDCWSVELTLKLLGKKVLVQDFILAPRVGVIQIGILNTNFQLLGWQSLTAGTVGGQDVSVFTNLALLRITKKPAAQTAMVGGIARFSATASGNAPLSYQWTKDGTLLTDDARTTGSATTNLTIAPAQNSDAGSYALVVTDLFGSITSSPATLTLHPDTIAPTVTIAIPTLNARTPNSVISGAASDNIRVAHVYYWFTNINHGVITVSATNEAALHGTNAAKISWEATAAPLPGTNILVVRAQDYQGNNSLMLSRVFFFQVPSLFTLAQAGNGNGMVTGKAAIAGEVVPTNNVMLNLGEGYSITAIPDKNSFLTNWSGTLGMVTNGTLNFIMAPNFTLQANFVTNLFIRMVGSYNGLFLDNNTVHGAREETAGLVGGLTVSSNGTYTGKLWLNGAPPYALGGKFDLAGRATNIVARAPALGGPFRVSMNLDWNNSPRQILGSVSGTNGGAWNSFLHLIAGPANPVASAEYTMIIPPAPSSAGSGYALLTNKAGVITLNGKLADGTTFNQTAPVSEISTVPLYASLYNNTGLLLGWLNLDRGALGDAAPAGDLTWIRKASPATLLYPNGFTNFISVQGSVWSNRAPALVLAAGRLDISDGGLLSPLNFNVAISTNNTLVKLDNLTTNSLTGTIDRKTGLLTVTFGNGAGRATAVGQGAVLQISNNAAGAFLGRTNSGSISLY